MVATNESAFRKAARNRLSSDDDDGLPGGHGLAAFDLDQGWSAGRRSEPEVDERGHAGRTEQVDGGEGTQARISGLEPERAARESGPGVWGRTPRGPSWTARAATITAATFQLN